MSLLRIVQCFIVSLVGREFFLSEGWGNGPVGKEAQGDS